MEIKAEELKAWVEDELYYADKPERAVVSYRERLFLGGDRQIDEKDVAVDAGAIAEALNNHGKESVDVGKVRTYNTDDGNKYPWTVEFSVYI